MTDTVNLYQDQAGEYRWHRKSGNGETISDSAEGYTSKVDARRMAYTLNPGIRVEDLTESDAE